MDTLKIDIYYADSKKQFCYAEFYLGAKYIVTPLFVDMVTLKDYLNNEYGLYDIQYKVMV